MQPPLSMAVAESCLCVALRRYVRSTALAATCRVNMESYRKPHQSQTSGCREHIVRGAKIRTQSWLVVDLDK